MRAFLAAVAIRFVGGAIIGAVLSVLGGWKLILEMAAEQQGFPTLRIIVWALAGGVICVLTTPRRLYPWRRR